MRHPDSDAVLDFLARMVTWPAKCTTTTLFWGELMGTRNAVPLAPHSDASAFSRELAWPT